tara:strand:+ start:3299 stop:4129 length:831 start_codon:yes stop_codon:yes gene_type:complete
MVNSKGNGGSKRVVYAYGFFILLMIILAFVYKDELSLIYSSPESVKQFISNFGAFAPIALILLQTAQVIIFVIPGPVFTIAGGYIFGTTLGTIYSLIGTLLGSCLVFYISKRFGRPFVEKIVSKKDLDHFDIFFKTRGKIALFISRTIPILFPNDVVSFAAGLTSLKWKDYVLISFLGFIPQIVILTFFGDKLTENLNPITIGIVAIIGFGALAYVFRHPLKILFIKEIKVVEKDLIIVEESSLKEVKIIEKDISHTFQNIKTKLGLLEKTIIHKK